MPDPDAVRRLLEGDIDPVEIEEDPELYSMAERIYGSEALDEMGVQSPQVGSFQEVADFGQISDDISLPDFVPDLPDLKFGKQKVGAKRRYFSIFTGIIGILGVIINNILGGGYILCSIGVADYPYICNPNQGNYKLVIENGYSWERLHTTDAWTQPMDYGIVDAILIGFFLLIAIFGFFKPRKSVHPGNELPLSG